ncbi:unnamed protein product [Cylicocyclus nassatus]|uniref:Uncharacterized protein n=1 Tax=Cylicocyclus nassatus TaxID=53992 RepID=A0AA36M2L7_CYLNA|nr:unnamed protein product [Cylicocyclus nassatus]
MRGNYRYPVCGRNYSDIYIPSMGAADGANSLRKDIENNGPFSVGWSALTGNLQEVQADGHYVKYFADDMWEGNFTFLGWSSTNWTLVITDAGQSLTDKQLLVQEADALALINLTAAARWRNVTGLNYYL